MSEFTENWSLQAIVQGSSGDCSKALEMETNEESSIFNFTNDQDFLAGIFPEIFMAPSTGSQVELELEDLYKPFYQVPHTLPSRTVLDFQEHNNPNGDDDQKQGPDLSDQSSGSIGSGSVTLIKHKRSRKNQHKRVVIQVSADGLSSDMWAWRKYGQKPIKGSPYPRSYYRCSSSKGCLARKQVEQSCTDPGKFIITYSGEHSHTQPTRRNSLAGTVRQKFPSTKTHNTYKSYKKESNKSLKQHTPSSAFPQTRRIKEEKYNPENEPCIKDEEKDDDFTMSEPMFGDDFFSGLEDFDFLNVKNPTSLRSCS